MDIFLRVSYSTEFSNDAAARQDGKRPIRAGYDGSTPQKCKKKVITKGLLK